jgi:hypothetical protein
VAGLGDHLHRSLGEALAAAQEQEIGAVSRAHCVIGIVGGEENAKAASRQRTDLATARIN